MVTIEEIANLFDEVDVNYLKQFEWKPNQTLEQGVRTYTLKDRFKVKFRDMVCIYDNIEQCRVKFHAIFQDNLQYVFQCMRLADKIEKITDSNQYEFISEHNAAGASGGKVGAMSGNNVTTVMINDQKAGALGGSGDAAQLGSLWQDDAKAVLTTKVLDKKEEAMMQFLDPNLRQYNQSYSRTKGGEGSMVNNLDYSNSWSNTSTNNRMITKRRVEAENELIALNAKIPRLVDEFLECFNPLFYY